MGRPSSLGGVRRLGESTELISLKHSLNWKLHFKGGFLTLVEKQMELGWLNQLPMIS